MLKICVFSAIFGDYDIPQKPKVIGSGVDYLMFSDNPELDPPPPWKLIVIKPWCGSPTMNAKYIKIMAHRHLSIEYDYSLWIDGSIQLLCDPKALIKPNIDCMLVVEHYKRGCLFKEIQECKTALLDSEWALEASRKLYEEADFVSPTGLYYGGFLIRNHTVSAVKFNRLWWILSRGTSSRDQIHLPPALELSGVPYKIIPKERRGNLFVVKDHKKGIENEPVAIHQ